MQLEIITHKEDNKQDAVFYYDKEIATIQLPNGNTLYLQSRGEVEILTDNGKVIGTDALKWLKDNNHNDETLDELHTNDMVSMSNWFAINEVGIDGETITDDLVLNGTYDEALDDLKVAYNDFYANNLEKGD